jgi:putative SOS response-associated peptidase YedK
MCGRFMLFASPDELREHFKLDLIRSELLPSYNIAPTQLSQGVVQSPGGRRAIVELKWGLIPSWAKDPKIASKLINARAETILEKPSFRESFLKRRCLIPNNGFPEWAKGSRQPMLISLKDKKTCAFAAIYDIWIDPQSGQKVYTFAILTTQANSLTAPIHARMPVILPEEVYDIWLDPRMQDIELLQSLLKPFDPEQMDVYPISPEINKVSYNQPEALLPYSPGNL